MIIMIYYIVLSSRSVRFTRIKSIQFTKSRVNTLQIQYNAPFSMNLSSTTIDVQLFRCEHEGLRLLPTVPMYLRNNDVHSSTENYKMHTWTFSSAVMRRGAVRRNAGRGVPAPATHFLKGSKTPAFVATFMTIYSQTF